MCGRYRRTTSEEELARLYHIPIPSQTDLPISYNIAPSQKVLTIRFNPETRARSLDAGRMDHQPLRRKYGSAHTQLTRIFEVQGDRRFGGLCRQVQSRPASPAPI